MKILSSQREDVVRIQPLKRDIYPVFLRAFRPRRLRTFYRLFQIDSQTKVLDIGGGAWFWDLALSEGLPLPQVTVLNIVSAGNEARGYLDWIVGDARSINLRDHSFDVVFSNSLVEHLGDWDSQRRFAEEVRRLAPRYFVQTPDRSCPIEPHFVTPFVHWLPKSIRPHTIRNLTVWGLTSRPSRSECIRLCQEISLLSKREMGILFPDGRILSERFMGLPKSITAVKSC